MKKFRIETIKLIIEKLQKNRRWLLALSVMVVFVTTYMLILPAFTLEKDEAAEQGGIDIPTAEQLEAETKDTDSDDVIDSTEESAVAEEDSLIYEGENYKVSVVDTESVLLENTESIEAEIDKKGNHVRKQTFRQVNKCSY